MGQDVYKGTAEKLKGKTVSGVEITDDAVVIKFEDNTFLDVYIDPTTQSLKTSTNKV